MTRNFKNLDLTITENSLLHTYNSLFKESEFESATISNDSKYSPLTLEEEVIVTTCITCLHTFSHAGVSNLISKAVFVEFFMLKLH